MNFKHLFKHDFVTVLDTVFVTGYRNKGITEVTRKTTKICNVCSKIKTTEKLLKRYNELYSYEDKLKIGKIVETEYGVDNIKYGDI